MRQTKLWGALALAGAVALGSFQANAQQPPYVPQPTPSAAGGLGHSILAAVVRSDGTHVAGTGGTGLLSTARLALGQYEVIFQRNQDRCFVASSVTDRNGFSTTHGFVTVVRRSGNDNGYFIRTYDDTNAAADRFFSLIVYCNG